MSCLITSCITIACEDRRRVGGLNFRIWRVNSMDGFSYVTDAAGYVTDFTFANAPAQGLVTIQGLREAHSSEYSLVAAEGGTTGYTHTVRIKTIANSPEFIAVLEDHDVADGAFVVETNGGEFWVYGINNGMYRLEGSQNFGNVANSDTSDIRAYQGDDTRMPKRFFDTDYNTTLAKLVSYEVCP